MFRTKENLGTAKIGLNVRKTPGRVKEGALRMVLRVRFRAVWFMVSYRSESIGVFYI